MNVPIFDNKFLTYSCIGHGYSDFSWGVLSFRRISTHQISIRRITITGWQRVRDMVRVRVRFRDGVMDTNRGKSWTDNRICVSPGWTDNRFFVNSRMRSAISC